MSSCIVIHVSDTQFFFSTDHCQDTTNEFTPISIYNRTIDDIRLEYSDLIEVENPDPMYNIFNN